MARTRTQLTTRDSHIPPTIQGRINALLESGLTKLSVAITEATFAALGDTDTSEVVALGTLPANTQINGVNIRLATPFTGGGNAACAVKIGSTGDDDAIVATANLFAAAVDGNVSALTNGIAPNKFFSAATVINGTFTADVGLKELTAGSCTIEILYTVETP